MTMNVSQEDIYALRHFNRFYTRKAGILEPYLNSQFSLTEVRVLYEIAHNDDLVASKLVDTLGLDSSYLSRILKSFEKRGWLTRQLSQTDHRQSIIRLTMAGREAYEPLQAKSNDSAAELLGMMDAENIRKVLDAMRTIENCLADPQSGLCEATRNVGESRTKNSTVKLRGIIPGDLGWVVEQHGQIYAKEYGWNIEFEALVAEIIADMPRQLDGITGQGWIAEHNNTRVGAIFVICSRPGVAKIRLLIVHPSARGLGLGYLLTDAAIDFARQAGYEGIELWTHSCLTAARKIYANRGFQLVASESYRKFGQALIGETWSVSLVDPMTTIETSSLRDSLQN